MREDIKRGDLVKKAFIEGYKLGVSTIDDDLSDVQLEALAEDFFVTSTIYTKHLSHWDK